MINGRRWRQEQQQQPPPQPQLQPQLQPKPQPQAQPSPQHQQLQGLRPTGLTVEASAPSQHAGELGQQPPPTTASSSTEMCRGWDDDDDAELQDAWQLLAEYEAQRRAAVQ
jgi:hypothetical protein